MKVSLSYVQFDTDVKGPGMRNEGGPDGSHTSTTFATEQKNYKVVIELDTAIGAVRLSHPTSTKRKTVLVPWSRVVSSDEVDLDAATAPAKKP